MLTGHRFHSDFSTVSQATLTETFTVVNHATQARLHHFPGDLWDDGKRKNSSAVMFGEGRKEEENTTKHTNRTHTYKRENSAPARESRASIPEGDKKWRRRDPATSLLRLFQQYHGPFHKQASPA